MPPMPLRKPGRWPLSNVLAIAHKELKAYFASPIAYVVIGFFALMFGYFYWALLGYFVQESTRAMGLQGVRPRTSTNR